MSKLENVKNINDFNGMSNNNDLVIPCYVILKNKEIKGI